MLNEWRDKTKKGKKTQKAQRTPSGQIRGNLSIKLVMTVMNYNPLNEIVSTDIQMIGIIQRKESSFLYSRKQTNKCRKNNRKRESSPEDHHSGGNKVRVAVDI